MAALHRTRWRPNTAIRIIHIHIYISMSEYKLAVAEARSKGVKQINLLGKDSASIIPRVLCLRSLFDHVGG